MEEARLDIPIMTSGLGLTSYANNSSFQRDVRLLVQPLIEEAIQEMNKFSSSKTINIADLGCCFGPNTLSSVQTIVDAMIHKHTLHGADSCHHEIQVFFNDRPTNDFNALFTSLPSNRPYFSAGVPGSFYGRLFPKASLHFVHSSYALHWLSELPNEVMDVNSPAWNKGRIYYAGGPMAVVEAYRTQFLKDLEVFLNARAEETVCGGLMTLLFPTQEEEIGPINSPTALCLNLLGSALMEIANEGLIEESQVDSFNFPAFCPSAEEFQKAVEKNGFFSIERQEMLRVPSNHSEVIEVKKIVMHMRSGFEKMLSKHFGSEIIDELFCRYEQMISENRHMFKSTNIAFPSLFVLLKRKDDHEVA